MAIRSCGSSMKLSSSSARSSWRKRAELSIVTLESSAITSRSLVTTIGLTSIRVASLSLNASWSFTIISAVFPRASSSTPASATRAPACASPKPSCGSMWRRTSASGSFSAISSTFMPPIVESIASSFLAERSRMIEA